MICASATVLRVVIHSFEAIEARWRPKGKNGLKVKQRQRPVKGCREFRNLKSLVSFERQGIYLVAGACRSRCLTLS